jgi:uncharacterized protein
MKTLLIKKFISFSLLLLMTFMSFAQDSKDFPQQPQPPRLVNDFAGMMNPSQQDELEHMLRTYNDSTSTQISIVTVQSLNDHDIAEYATTLAQNWGIGRKGKNNGVLILASSGDRKMWIATGYGMEGALPDATVFSIVNNEMKPEFKAGNYYLGFRKAVDAIIQASKGEYVNEDRGKENDGNKGGPAGFIILIIILFVIFAAVKGGGRGGRGGGGGGFLTGMILGNLLGGGRSSWDSGGGFGGGGNSGGGGGGFGGFGGGGFGGGGAGGSW